MKLSIIGGGNMGGAIALGALVGNKVEDKNLRISHCTEYWLKQFAAQCYHIICCNDNKLVIQDTDVIIIAVKPWMVEQIMNEIRDSIQPHQLIVSVAARVTFQQMEEYLGIAAGKIAMFSVIPNTAIAVGEGTSFIASQNATIEQMSMVVELFNTMGKTILVEENLIGAYTSLSSCGIAYALKYIDSAMKGGIEIGIEQQMALEIVIQTIKGALALLEKNNTLPQTEIDKVTTPGGITFKGLEAMEKCGFSNAVIQGLKSSQ